MKSESETGKVKSAGIKTWKWKSKNKSDSKSEKWKRKTSTGSKVHYNMAVTAGVALRLEEKNWGKIKIGKWKDKIEKRKVKMEKSRSKEVKVKWEEKKWIKRMEK